VGKPRVLIVTEADAGVGRATAILLAERGMRVLAVGRSAEAMRDLPRETGQGGLIETRVDALADAEHCRAAVSEAERLFGPLYGAVLTETETSVGPVEEVDEATLRALVERNFYTPFRMIQATVAALRPRRRGAVVCVSSAAGRVALPMTGAFSASQYALEGLCDALRQEVAVFGVDVVLVEPGVVRSGVVVEARPERDPTQVFGVSSDSPYREVALVLGHAIEELARRAATPHDVATVVYRSLTARNPRARYAVTRGTAALLWARKLLPDRFLDSRLAKRAGLDGLEF